MTAPYSQPWYRDPDKLRELMRLHGSYAAVSRATGVPESTLKTAASALGFRKEAAPEPQEVPWGTGAAKPVRNTKPNEVVVFLSDIHIPYQDTALVASALRLIEDVRPDRVVINGDVADFFQCSRFNMAEERMEELQSDIDAANAFRRSVREAAPNAAIDETEGNHDNRITTYVRKNARAVASLRSLEPRFLFAYDDLDINVHPGCGFLLRPFFLVKHGTIVRGEAGATAKAELLAAGINGISGHTHRLATYRKSGYGQRQWTEQGCMCRLDPDYVPGGVPNWTQGIAVGEFSASAFVIHEVPFTDGALRLGLRTY